MKHSYIYTNNKKTSNNFLKFVFILLILGTIFMIIMSAMAFLNTEALKIKNNKNVTSAIMLLIVAAVRNIYMYIF